MQLETLVDRHNTEIINIRDSMSEIAMDLQLLVKDHKFLSEKMQEISINIHELLVLANDVKQGRADINCLNREVEFLKENCRFLEKRLTKLDTIAEQNNKLWDHFLNRWLRILAILIPVLTALLVIYFK